MNPDTLPRLLQRKAADMPSAPAFRLKQRGIWQTLNWLDFHVLVSDFTRGLLANGVQRGARLAVLGDNRPRLYAAMLGIQTLGGTAVPLDPDAGPAQITPRLRDTGVSVVVVQDQEQLEKLHGAQALPDPPLIICEMQTDNDIGAVAYDAIIAAGRNHCAGHPHAMQPATGVGHPDDTAMLFSTSDGGKHCAAVSHRRLLAAASAIAAAEDVRPCDNAFCYLPMSTIGDAVYSLALGLTIGFTCNCPEAPHTVLRDLREIGPDMLLAPPPLWAHLADTVEQRARAATAFKRRVFRLCQGISLETEHRREADTIVPLGLRIADRLADIAVNRPIRDQLGLARMRWVHVGADKLNPALLRRFRALGINLRRDESECVAMVSQPEETAHA